MASLQMRVLWRIGKNKWLIYPLQFMYRIFGDVHFSWEHFIRKRTQTNETDLYRWAIHYSMYRSRHACVGKPFILPCLYGACPDIPTNFPTQSFILPCLYGACPDIPTNFPTQSFILPCAADMNAVGSNTLQRRTRRAATTFVRLYDP
jgi:hypothetical protein